MREVDINSGGLQRGPVRGAEAGGGGHRAGADNGSVCPSKVFLSGRERGERAGRPGGDILRRCMMGQTDCIYLLSHCARTFPPPPLSTCRLRVCTFVGMC